MSGPSPFTSLPLSDHPLNYEFFKLVNRSAPSCGLLTYRSVGLFNYIESLIYNTVEGQFNYGKNSVMCNAYTVAAMRRR